MFRLNPLVLDASGSSGWGRLLSTVIPQLENCKVKGYIFSRDPTQRGFGMIYDALEKKWISKKQVFSSFLILSIPKLKYFPLKIFSNSAYKILKNICGKKIFLQKYIQPCIVCVGIKVKVVLPLGIPGYSHTELTTRIIHRLDNNGLTFVVKGSCTILEIFS